MLKNLLLSVYKKSEIEDSMYTLSDAPYPQLVYGKIRPGSKTVKIG